MAESTAPVSVIIPCFNCSATIERAVASVMGQTLLPEELILVDDCSQDGGATQRALSGILARNAHVREPLVKVMLSERNGGPSSARNAGWAASTKAFIAFLDADDAWHPQKIEIQYRWMRDNPDFHGSGHGTLLVRDLAKALATPAALRGVRRLTLASMMLSNHLSTRTVMINRDVDCRFQESLRFSEDYALWLELIASKYHLARLDVDLAFSFRPEFSAGGQSDRLWKMEQSEINIFKRLMRERKVGWSFGSVAIILSIVKFIRRIAINLARRPINPDTR